MVKSGRLRSLIKELETKYVQDDACCKPLHSNMGSCNSSCVHLESTHIHQNRAKLRSLTALKENVKLVEVEYDRCNEAKVRQDMLGLCEERPG